MLSSAPRRNWFKRVLGFGPYFRPRSNALEGMMVASFVGVCSGYYIFKPLLDEIATNQAERKRREALEAAAAGGAGAAGSVAAANQGGNKTPKA